MQLGHCEERVGKEVRPVSLSGRGVSADANFAAATPKGKCGIRENPECQSHFDFKGRQLIAFTESHHKNEVFSTEKSPFVENFKHVGLR